MNIDKLKQTAEQFASANEIIVISVNCSTSNEIEIILDSLTGVQLDKCIELNKLIEAEFDRDKEDYELTVASASISEPFSHYIQYQKNIGRDVEVELNDSTKYFGLLESVNENQFTISYSEKVIEEGKKRKILKDFTKEIKFEEVKETKLQF